MTALALFLIFLIQMIILLICFAKSVLRSIYKYRNIVLFGYSVLSGCFAIYTAFCCCDPFSGITNHSSLIENIFLFPKRFSLAMIIFISAVCVILMISNAFLVKKEGFRPKNVFGFVFAFLYIGGAAIVFLISNLIEKYAFAHNGIAVRIVSEAICLFMFLMLSYFEISFCGSVFMGYYAAKKKPEYDVDFIIILGCKISKKGGLLPLLKGRVNTAIRFRWDQERANGKALIYIPSGGQGKDEVMSEGSAMELYLLTRGAEYEEIIAEKESKYTYQNFLYSKKIIDEINPDAKIAFSTTNYHILRSGMIADKYGIDAKGIASDTKWYFWINGFIREFFGILAMNIKTHIFIAVLTAIISFAAAFIKIQLM